MNIRLTTFLGVPLLISFGATLNTNDKPQQIESWPKGITEIHYKTTADNTLQPALMYQAKSTQKRPLLVGLHTWSGDYTQAGGQTVYAKWCKQNDWHFIHPHFRGANNKPGAMGSDYVVKDIESAVKYMQKQFQVDTRRIYLIGVSGGAHCVMLMASRKPHIWAGVSAWCGIYDLPTWWQQCSQSNTFKKYARNIEQASGGSLQKEAHRKEALKRSPITYLKHARTQKIPIDINHGINDGRKGSVPFTQSLHAFNLVAKPKDVLDSVLIEAYYQSRKLPSAWKKADSDTLYGRFTPLFRKVSGNARVTIFSGGHDIHQYAGLNWLAVQRKGKPAVWEIPQPVKGTPGKDENASGL